jgi:hypothetical protein
MRYQEGVRTNAYIYVLKIGAGIIASEDGYSVLYDSMQFLYLFRRPRPRFVSSIYLDLCGKEGYNSLSLDLNLNPNHLT